MEGNDIAPYLTSTVAVMFEGLAFTDSPLVIPEKRKLWQRKKDVDLVVRSTVRKWKARDLPLKSLLHMIDRLAIKVDVYTYYDVDYVEEIEHWLARKGASVQVFSYEDLEALRDDFKYNRDVRQLFTPFEDDAAVLGPRATVMDLDKTWGF